MPHRIYLAAWSIKEAVRHPRTPIVYGNPGPAASSPIPWWGSVGVLLIGIIAWFFAAKFSVPGLDEAARAMVYIPLGNIFGMTLQLKDVKKGK